MTSTIDNSSFAVKRENILNAICVAAKNAGRNPKDINLVAVCKTQSRETVECAIEAGQLCFGENRVSEGLVHFPNGLKNGELRMIGPLQSNKAEDAVRLFDVIETLDRPSLAKALKAAIEKIGRTPKILIQVNIGEEAQKSGVLLQDLADFLALAKNEYCLPISGLMCIPPAEEPPAPYFALIQKIAKAHKLNELSMGMSGDFETAIKFGATHVRIGSALFGER